MHYYLILFYFSIFFSLSSIQKNTQFKLSTYAITMHSDTISDLKQFGSEEFFNNIKKNINKLTKILIIDDKNTELSINSNNIYNYDTFSKLTPQEITLDPIILNQYNKIFCFINPTTYDHASEMTIKFLANENVKTHYFILNQSNYSAVLERIDYIYLQADIQKFIQIQQLNKQNTLINRFKQNLYLLKNSFKQNLYSSIISFYNKIT